MARADFITSLILMLFGSAVTALSWRMPRFTEYGTGIWSAPGIVPGMLGIALAVMGALLLLRSRRDARLGVAADADAPVPDRPDWIGVLAAFALCIAFAAGLIGRVPFVLATFLFVAAFALLFDARDQAGDITARRRIVRAVLALAIAAGAAFAIATIFQDIFVVQLP